ncbi:MAG: GDSL-type esterase/lipase family protein [Tagaea sp.]|nr:GDSL-type esterase/lipase family protein [Tagaea sp.]
MRLPLLPLIFLTVATAGAAERQPVIPSMDRKVEQVAARCEVPGDMLALRHPLPHVARRLAEGRQLTVVALGSSSTQGTGASSPALAYPARLESELHALLPHMAITVINKGVGGEDAAQMLARFESDVLAVEPDLLIWQAGVNAAIRGTALDEFVEHMSDGIERARARGIDVMLLGPQNAPRYVAARQRREYSEHLMLLSRLHDAPIFPRFRIMTHWVASGAFRADEIVAADGLHMTDASYYCLARLLARAIASAGPSPQAAR